MSTLFDGHERGDNLIHLPRKTDEGTKALIEQLTTWEPMPPGAKTKKKIDLVMALWFAEIRARELVNEIGNIFNMENKYMSPRDRERSVTIDLDYMGQAAMASGAVEWWGS